MYISIYSLYLFDTFAAARIHVADVVDENSAVFPCRDENLHCTDKCSCGSKKSSCKNKEQSTTTATNANAGKNAFDCHQAAIEVSNREITVSKTSDNCDRFNSIRSANIDFRRI